MFYNARYYSPGIIRFISADTIVPDPKNPQAWNRYSYVLNNPVKYTDPSGHRIDDGCGTEGCATDEDWAENFIQGVEQTTDFSNPSDDPMGQLTQHFYQWTLNHATSDVEITPEGALRDAWHAAATHVRASGLSPADDLTQMREMGFAYTSGLVNSVAALTIGRNVGFPYTANAGSPSKFGAESSYTASGCSFSADTLVMTDNGEQPISTLKVGDHVYAYNTTLGVNDYYTVTAVLVHDDPLIEYLVIDGEQIETTPEHPFYTLGFGWLPAGQLWSGIHIRKADSSYGTVQAIQLARRDQQMYNLTVAEAHTFFVGSKQWLVHNGDCPPGFRPMSPKEVKKYGLHREKPGGRVPALGKLFLDEDTGDVISQGPYGGPFEFFDNILARLTKLK